MNKERMRAQAARLRMLAEFRHQIRLFLQFSETAAKRRGLQPQQHQLLLQIAGSADNVAATIGFAAERLGLRHNTVVELSNRSEAAGLVVRKQAGSDRRCVLLELSPRGRAKLEALSIDHAREHVLQICIGFDVARSAREHQAVDHCAGLRTGNGVTELRFPRYFVFQQVDFMQPARPDFVR